MTNEEITSWLKNRNVYSYDTLNGAEVIELFEDFVKEYDATKDHQHQQQIDELQKACISGVDNCVKLHKEVLEEKEREFYQDLISIHVDSADFIQLCDQILVLRAKYSHSKKDEVDV